MLRPQKLKIKSDFIYIVIFIQRNAVISRPNGDFYADWRGYTRTEFNFPDAQQPRTETNQYWYRRNDTDTQKPGIISTQSQLSLPDSLRAHEIKATFLLVPSSHYLQMPTMQRRLPGGRSAIHPSLHFTAILHTSQFDSEKSKLFKTYSLQASRLDVICLESLV